MPKSLVSTELIVVYSTEINILFHFSTSIDATDVYNLVTVARSF